MICYETVIKKRNVKKKHARFLGAYINYVWMCMFSVYISMKDDGNSRGRRDNMRVVVNPIYGVCYRSVKKAIHSYC